MHPIVVACAPERRQWVTTLAARDMGDAVGFVTRRHHHALGGAKIRTRHARHAAIARELIRWHAQQTLADQRDRFCQRMTDRGGVALSPSALGEWALRFQFIANVFRSIFKQRIPARVFTRQQMQRSLCDQWPHRAFELLESGHLEGFTQSRVRGCGQAFGHARVHREPPRADDAIAHRFGAGAAFPAFRCLGQLSQCR